MGCGSSAVKVDPKQTASPKKKKNSVSPIKNQIRGDRLSMVDARQRREDESKERRRRLSLKQTDQVDKATRRRSSSIASSSKDNSSTMLQENNINSHNKNQPAPNGDVYNNVNHNTKNDIQTFHQSDSDSDIGTDLQNELKTNKGKRKPRISDIQEYPIHANSFDEQNKENKYGQNKNQDDLSENRIIFTESPNPRQSVNSVDLQNNANSIVSNILAQAMVRVENEKNDNTINRIPSSNSQRTYSAKSAAGSTVADEHAKNIVSGVLNNALIQVKSENIGDTT